MNEQMISICVLAGSMGNGMDRIYPEIDAYDGSDTEDDAEEDDADEDADDDDDDEEGVRTDACVRWST